MHRGPSGTDKAVINGVGVGAIREIEMGNKSASEV